MNGKIVIDGSWEGEVIDEPITMEVEKVVTKISKAITENINGLLMK